MKSTSLSIAEIKQIPISSFLESIGITPINTIGGQILYSSPLTKENTASFFVEPRKNVFNDFSSGNKGDIISLVRSLFNCSFNEAIERLKTSDLSHSFSFSGSTPIQRGKIKIEQVLPLSNKALINYVNSRAISLEMGFKYLKEIHYSTNGRKYFAVGFKNNAGGYELRNGLGFKGKTINGITTIEKNTKSISIFEGFFDFLSALQYYKLKEPNNTTIILNTTNNIKLAIQEIKNPLKIYSFLDNDKSGEATLNKLSENFEVINISKKMYCNHKDFNDFINHNEKT